MVAGFLVAAALLPLVHAQTNYVSVQSTLVPLVLLAILVDSAIVSAWYMAGALLNNPSLKGGAIEEFYQLAGTAILTVLIVGILLFASTSYIGVLSATKLMNPTALQNICNGMTQFNDNGGLTVLGDQAGSYLSVPSGTGSAQFPGFCNIIAQASGGGATLAEQIDYPLAASGVITANLLNQSAVNLNSASIFASYIGFLAGMTPTTSICFAPEAAFQLGGPCLIPGFSDVTQEPSFTLTYSSKPLAGYTFITGSLTTLGTLITTTFTSLTAQLSFLVMMVFAWPYLLFIGLVLRATVFTRKIGGLLIAIAIGELLFFPLVFSFEYFALSNPVFSSNQTTSSFYGYSQVTDIPQCTATGGVYSLCQKQTYYNLNFYSMPNIRALTEAYNCTPTNLGGLLGAEAADIGETLIPGFSAFRQISVASQTPTTVPDPSFVAECHPQPAIETLLSMLEAYGITGITVYLLPLVNLFITISAILGISGLVGGDTGLAGLSRLL